MKFEINANAEGRKEISAERTRMFNNPTDNSSNSENTALSEETVSDDAMKSMYPDKTPAWIAWKKGKEQKGLNGKEAFQGKFSDSLSFGNAKENKGFDSQNIFSETKVRKDHNEKGLGEWNSYNPWKENKKEKEVSLNTATVVAIRKRLMAAEWARALGRPVKKKNSNDLDPKVSLWYQNEQRKKKRKEEVSRRIEGYKNNFNESLRDFCKLLKEQKDSAEKTGPKELSALLEKSLDKAGDIINIEWDKKGCQVWLEPWEEKTRQEVSEFDLLGIYKAEINERLELILFENVDDENDLEFLKSAYLTKSLRDSLNEVFFDIDEEEKAADFLDENLSEIGRVLELKRTDSGWLALLETWENMRERKKKESLEKIRMSKQKKISEPSTMITDRIFINWNDGKLEFVFDKNEKEI